MAGSMDDERKRWKEKRDREREREEQEEQDEEITPEQVEIPQNLLQSFQKADILIDQVNHLYNSFFSGSEKRPPLEKRKELEQMILQIQQVPKYVASAIFRYNGLQARYTIYRDRWDKLMKDLEKGLLKRSGPGRPNP